MAKATRTKATPAATSVDHNSLAEGPSDLSNRSARQRDPTHAAGESKKIHRNKPKSQNKPKPKSQNEHKPKSQNKRKRRPRCKLSRRVLVFLCFYIACIVASIFLVAVSFHTAEADGHGLNLLYLYPVSTIESLALCVHHSREFLFAKGSKSPRGFKFFYAFSVILVLGFNVAGWTLWRIGQSSHNNGYLQLAYLFFHIIAIQFTLLLPVGMFITPP